VSNSPTQKELKEQFHYDPDTGLFTPRAYVGKQGYVLIKVNGMVQRAHRMAFLYVTGSLPKEYVDHINGQKSDNRWVNLREATNGQNQHNAKLFSNNTSGCKGVSPEKRTGKWFATIRVDGKRKHLGTYSTFEEAVAARKAAEAVVHGEFSRGK
jgi:hypothetical protein